MLEADEMLFPEVEMDIQSIKLDDKILIRPIIDSHVVKLYKSIKKHGQTDAVIIEEYKHGLFHVVCHAHEYSALKILEKEWLDKRPTKTFKIKIKRFKGTEAERLELQLLENTHHLPMEMVQVGQNVERLLNLNPDRTQAEISEEVGWSKQYISDCLKAYNDTINHATKPDSSDIGQNEKCSTARDSTEEANNCDLNDSNCESVEDTPETEISQPIEPNESVSEENGIPSLEDDIKDLERLEKLEKSKVKEIASVSKFTKAIENMIKEAISLEGFKNNFSEIQTERIERRLNILLKKIENIKRNLRT